MSAAVASPSLKDLATATPDSRDRYVDLLRAFSIAVVVIGHWLMAIVFFRDGAISGQSALEVIPGMWLLTWVLQVMPLFFFVGGFSNLVSIRAATSRGQGRREFIRSRVERLMRPTVVFIASWLCVAFVLETFFSLGEEVHHATAMLAKPVWFLAVYLLVVALAPSMLALHERFRVWVPAAMVASAAAVDVVRISFDLELIGYLNFAFVWLFAHQLGFFYADGTLAKRSRAFFAASAVLGLAALVILTNVSVYSRSMVGVADAAVSNNDPPSVCLIALTAWLVSLAMLLRPVLTRWLQKPRNWTAVIAANSLIMTVFLWHLTALLVAVLVAYPLGFPQFEGGTSAWWLTRPLWIAVLVLALTPFVILFAKFERPRFRLAGARDPGVPPKAALIVGIALLVIGMGGFAQGGFAGIAAPTGTTLGIFEANPLLSALHLGVGLALVRKRSRVTVAVASAALVGIGVLEAFPFASDVVRFAPITTGNTLLHLACGGVLSLFGHVNEEGRER